MNKFEEVKGNYFTPFTLRINESTVEKLKNIAVKNKRSLNKQIEFILEEWLEKQNKN